MSTHTGFLIAACISAIVTLPAIVYAHRRRLPYRALAMGLYVAGYAGIAAALILDPVVQPPLFVHGFVPGIGTGLIVVALALVHLDWVAARRKAAGAGSGEDSVPNRSR